MERGLYIAASGMLADQLRLDVLANNLANASTTGYKGDRVASRNFGDVLLKNMGEDADVGPLTLGAQLEGADVALVQGALKPTGRDLDVAISGPAFFSVQTETGVRYTRDGAFTRDAQGFLVTASGNRVLGANGPIEVPAGKVAIAADGAVSVNGTAVGQLALVSLANVRKEGDNLFAGDAQAAAGATVQQGHLESANVNAVTEMVGLITVMRSFESGQKVIQAIDETLHKASNEVGRI